MFDSGKGTELEAGDVGQNRGAADGDAIFDHQPGEGAEEVVDLAGGFKIQSAWAEVAREVYIEGGAEPGIDVLITEQAAGRDQEAAAPAGRVEMVAGGAGRKVGELRFHLVLEFEVGLGVHPGLFLEECASD